MTRMRLLSRLALLTTLALVTAACGQKAGIHLSSSGDGPTDGFAVDGGEGELGIGETTESGEVVVGYDAEGNVITASAGSEAAQQALSGGGTTTRTGTRTGATTTTTTKSGGGTPTTKVWGDTVVIGIHAPITGAAPLPSTFQSAATFVKGYFNDPAHPERRPHNRTIDIVIVDDQYQPAIATQRCQELVKQRNAFLLIGAAGTDQIQACARYAATAGVPYLSAGVTEKGLRTLKNYFAISMSYKQQASYLANFMKQTFPTLTTDPSKVFMVYSDTPNFGDAVAGFQAAFPGVSLKKLPRTPNPNDLGNAARELCTAGAKLAYPLMAPKDWLVLLGQQTTGCAIQWSGVGVTMGVNEVHNNGCNGALKDKFDLSTFFSPFPGVDKAKQLDADFAKALGTRADNEWDDIWVALWNTTRGMIELLRRTGPNLTRAAFVATTETATNVGGPPSAMNPPLNYSPADHFGARHVHVLQADCDGFKKYKTIATFAQY